MTRLRNEDGPTCTTEVLADELSPSVAHDLRGPLTAIVANLDLLERRIAPEDAHLVRRCRAGALRLHRMILDIQDVARLEAHTLPIQFEDLDVGGIVRRCVREASEAAEQRGLELEVRVEVANTLVRGDSTLLRRVVDNAITHALERAPKGSAVEVRVVGGADGVEICVADHGTTIPAEHRERVFDRESRIALRAAGLVVNRGLALTFCRLAITAHGGTMWVDGDDAASSTLRIVLPWPESARRTGTTAVTA